MADTVPPGTPDPDPDPRGDTADRLFALRLARSWDDLVPILERVYGHRDDFDDFRSRLIAEMERFWRRRPEDLKWLDLQRDLEPDWFQRPDRIGYVCYADRFAGDLRGVLDHLDWLESLGVTYLHIMPCLRPRPGDNDGGYSVMDYEAVDPRLGTMADLEAVAAELRRRGISLCIDVVLNHTAKEHRWAEAARAGDPAKRDYYLVFDDDTLPKAYERDLIEIFPDRAPGSFTHDPELDAWVWTTFNEHQWDLNWANPEVFLEMTRVMLGLANRGIDVLRFDAVAFMWKRLGTRCQSEPEVHLLLRALRAVTRVAAPAVIHLEEAIVAPAEMIPYLGAGEHAGREGNLAYHNSLMVQFWSALAARDTRLMDHVLRTHFPISLPNATYATYLRCHDDIGWAVTDEDAAAVGWGGLAHRAFLADFYEGTFPGSFARGVPFGVNDRTGDRRTSGTTASLAGLEVAQELVAEAAELVDGPGVAAARAEAEAAVDAAIDRILVGHALIAAFGGIPLIYMGDEIALLNDDTYLDEPDHRADSRWIHRPMMDWDRAALAAQGHGVEGRVLAGIRMILERRRATPELHGAHPTEIVDTGRAELFAFVRRAPTGSLVCVFNLSGRWSSVPVDWVRDRGATTLVDALSGHEVEPVDGVVVLPPHARVWIR